MLPGRHGRGERVAADALITKGASVRTVRVTLQRPDLGRVSVSHLDIAPRNAGLVFGAGNTLATLAGLLAEPLKEDSM
eukprot:jgi/Tetstr1/433403/TSEL_002398.t1